MNTTSILISALLAIVISWLVWLTKVSSQTASHVRDLHGWHAPGMNGEMSWKNPRVDELLITMRQLTVEVHELTHAIELDRVKREATTHGDHS